MCWAIDILLSLQNADGGFASYELIRGTRYMELINPAEVFVGLLAGWATTRSLRLADACCRATS